MYELEIKILQTNINICSYYFNFLNMYYYQKIIFNFWFKKNDLSIFYSTFSRRTLWLDGFWRNRGRENLNLLKWQSSYSEKLRRNDNYYFVAFFRPFEIFLKDIVEFSKFLDKIIFRHKLVESSSNKLKRWWTNISGMKL